MTGFRVKYFMIAGHDQNNAPITEQLSENELVLVKDTGDRSVRWLDRVHNLLIPGKFASEEDAIRWLKAPTNGILEALTE